MQEWDAQGREGGRSPGDVGVTSKGRRVSRTAPNFLACGVEPIMMLRAVQVRGGGRRVPGAVRHSCPLWKVVCEHRQGDGLLGGEHLDWGEEC